MEGKETTPKAKELPPKEILKELLQFGSYNILPDYKGKNNDKKDS